MPTEVKKYTPTVNVAFAMKLRYIDVWPNNTEKNGGKGYGSQVAIRGEIDGVDQRVYLKGFTDANIDGMVNAGIIAATDYNYDPAEKYSIPVKSGDITVTASQPAGEKHAKMKFALNGPAAQATQAATPAPTQGKRLPGEDDGYLDSLTNDEPPAVTKARAQLPTPAPHPGRSITASDKMHKAQSEYEEALTFALTVVCPKITKHGITVDGAAVNAMCATLMIQAGKSA